MSADRALLEAGDQVERYEVVRVLGVGGMAQVLLVRHTSLNTLHALKVLTLAAPDFARRLLEEGRVQARLDHPNVVPVRDVITVKGMPALVLDFVDGPDLERWIADVKPGAVLAEQLFRGIVAGVAAAHAAGVVHRDLKPANVLLEPAAEVPVPRIADFGLVKALEAETVGRTRAGVPLGTPQYMAPEQIRSAADVDQRADIWSLGCILYELVAHRQAYPGEDIVGVWERATKRERPPLPDDVPYAIARTVDKCLMPAPDDRPQSCEAVLALLDDRRPPLGAIDPASERGPAPVARGIPRGLVAAGASLASVIVVVGVTAAVLVAVLAARIPTPVCAGDGLLGYVAAPWVFDKPAGGAWRIEADTAVLQQARAGAKAACVLPAGARVTLASPAVEERDGARWVPVRGEGLVLGPAGAPLTAAEQEGTVGDRCEGAAGERLGWVLTYPKAMSRKPRQEGEWNLTFPRLVHAAPPERPDDPPGPAVCALRGQTHLVLAEAPRKVGRGWWLPVTAGRVDEGGAPADDDDE
ncbi:MAG: serine/threonine-protein kinase [Myxococcota bacterium]